MIKSVKKYNQKKWNKDTESYDAGTLVAYLLEYEDGTKPKLTVPLDENNRHYQEIQEWVAEGNTIQEAD